MFVFECPLTFNQVFKCTLAKVVGVDVVCVFLLPQLDGWGVKQAVEIATASVQSLLKMDVLSYSVILAACTGARRLS